MTFKTHANGRMSFPCVEYLITHENGTTEIVPYPPTYETHPAPTTPPALSSVHTARMIAQGEIAPIPSSLPYRPVVHDLPEYDRLAKSGALRDPRHTGHALSQVIDSMGANK